MKVRVTDVAPSEAGLVLGLVIHGKKDSWIRFAAVELTVELLDLDSRVSLTKALNRAQDRGAAWDLATHPVLPFEVTGPGAPNSSRLPETGPSVSA